jgi:hypothetical protein
MLQGDVSQEIPVIRGPLPQREAARHAQRSHLFPQLKARLQGGRAGEYIVHIDILSQRLGPQWKPALLVAGELAQRAHGELRSARQPVRDRSELVFPNLIFLCPQDSLKASVVRMYRDLAVHLFYVRDEDVAMTSPPRYDVRERRQQVGPGAQGVVERDSRRAASGSVEDHADLRIDAGAPQYAMVRQVASAGSGNGLYSRDRRHVTEGEIFGHERVIPVTELTVALESALHDLEQA